MQALRLIPRTPSPDPVEACPLEDRPLEELTPDEMRELIRRQRANKDDVKPIKQEVKRERSESEANAGEDNDIEVIDFRPKKKLRRIGVAAEVIDFTDDD